MFYIYRFKDADNNIVYVGRTDNIKRRMDQHFGNNGRPEFHQEVAVVEYITTQTKLDMTIKELYYINKWKPKFNEKDKQVEPITVKIDETDDVWKVIKVKNGKYIEKLEEKLARSKELIEKQESQLIKLKEENRVLQETPRFNIIKSTSTTSDGKRSYTYNEIKKILKTEFRGSFLCNIAANGKELSEYVIEKVGDVIFAENTKTKEKIPLESTSGNNIGLQLKIISYDALFSHLEFVTDEENEKIAESILNKINKEEYIKHKKRLLFDTKLTEEQRLLIRNLNNADVKEFINYLWLNKDKKSQDIINEWFIKKYNSKISV